MLTPNNEKKKHEAWPRRVLLFLPITWRRRNFVWSCCSFAFLLIIWTGTPLSGLKWEMIHNVGLSWSLEGMKEKTSAVGNNRDLQDNRPCELLLNRRRDRREQEFERRLDRDRFSRKVATVWRMPRSYWSNASSSMVRALAGNVPEPAHLLKEKTLKIRIWSCR